MKEWMEWIFSYILQTSEAITTHPPIIFPGLPSVFIWPNRIVLPLSKTGYVSCTTETSEPQPTVEWYEGKNKVPGYGGEIYQSSGYLILRSAAKDDVSIYTCRATSTINGKVYFDEKKLYLTSKIKCDHRVALPRQCTIDIKTNKSVYTFHPNSPMSFCDRTIICVKETGGYIAKSENL